MTSAWSKTNENWWDAPYINTWSTEGDNDGSGFSVPFFEMYVNDTNNLPLNTTQTATLTGLDNGCYDVTIWARVQRRTDANFGSNDEITMSVNDGEAVSIMNGEAIDGYADDRAMRIGRFTARGMVTDGTLTLSIKTGGAGSNVHWLCWRDVTYTKLPDNVSKTISSAGWSTYCSPYALDLANATGLTDAYIVTGGADGVLTKTSVKGGTVPANTGLLLKGDEGTATIPVVASSTTNVSANKLVGVTAATVLDLDDDDDGTADKSVYVLLKENDVLGFYQTTTTSFTVGANTAYLSSDFAGGGARSAYFFDSITGVENVEAAVEAAEKDGKFIENGQLVIKKNGKKFNAAGAQLY